MAIGDYSATRDNNASITPGNVRSNDPSRDQQIINAIRQLMADLAGFAGGVSPITSGIQFPATQVPSANANTLDDYEEGTWTPVITFTTLGDLSVTYSAQLGRYVKVGKIVHASCTVAATAFTYTTAAGEMRITGLPFASVNTSYEWAGSADCQNVTHDAGRDLIWANVPGNISYIRLVMAGSGTTRASVDTTNIASGVLPLFRLNVTYEAAA